MADTEQTKQTAAALVPGEVVETYVQPLPGEVVEEYCQAQPLPGKRPRSASVSPQEQTERRRSRRKIRKRRRVLLGAALGAVIVVLAASAGWLLGQLSRPSDSGGYYDDPSFQPSTNEAITIPTAPWGQGVTVEMHAGGGQELTPQEIYARVNPSVVTVMAWLDKGASVGTGVILTADGYILTNYHVLSGGNLCQIALDNGTVYDGSYVAGDAGNDIALLKVEAQGLPAAELGDSDELTVGDRVYAIGNPLGTELRGTFTDGIVSAIDRDVAVDDRTMTLIQTNAALNNGNSGGPLINAYGQVVGINTIKMSSSYSTIEGLGFALPTASVTYLVNDLLTYGAVQPEPLLGVSVSVSAVTLPDGTQGISVKEVAEGGAAEQAGVQEGDVIVTANGQAVSSSRGLLRIRRGLKVGGTLTLRLWRDGQYLERTLQLTEAVESGN